MPCKNNCPGCTCDPTITEFSVAVPADPLLPAPEPYRCDFPACKARDCDGACNAALPPEADPLDTPLPCDVTIGGGTHRKGTSLRTLVRRAQRLWEEAYGPMPSDEEKAANLRRLQAGAAPRPVGEAEWVQQHIGRGAAITARLYNETPNVADGNAAGEWIQVASQVLQMLAATPQPAANLEASGDSLTVGDVHVSVQGRSLTPGEVARITAALSCLQPAAGADASNAPAGEALRLAATLRERYGRAVPTSQAAALLEQQAARIAALEAELQENEALRERMADLLTGVAIALRGPQPENGRHGWADLPERAQAVMVTLAGALKAVENEAAQVERLRASLKSIHDAAKFSPYRRAGTWDQPLAGCIAAHYEASRDIEADRQKTKENAG